MNTLGDKQPFNKDYYPVQQAIRRQRRYDRLAIRHLPDWAPSSLKKRYRERLPSFNGSRIAQRHSRACDFGGAPAWHAAELARTVRFCTYLPRMKAVWKTLSKAPLITKEYAWIGDNASQVMYLLDKALADFDATQKITPANRRTGLNRVALKCEELLDAIAEVDEAAEIFKNAPHQFVERTVRGSPTYDGRSKRIRMRSIPTWRPTT